MLSPLRSAMRCRGYCLALGCPRPQLLICSLPAVKSAGSLLYCSIWQRLLDHLTGTMPVCAGGKDERRDDADTENIMVTCPV